MLKLEWIPRAINDKADYFSKIFDSDDWGFSRKLFDIINKQWRPFAIDWFASEHNAKFEKCYSRFWCEKSSGVDAFMEQWGGCNGYYVPSISQVCKVILHIRSCKAFDVLVTPYWQSVLFWPLSKGKFKNFVQDWTDFPTEKTYFTPCRSGNDIFGNENLKFKMIALKLCFEEADGPW